MMRPGRTEPGIIPARAGFTRRPRRRRLRVQDHPRSRGVYPPNRGEDKWTAGSSPLARGLQGAGGDEVVDGGIIPARAGFTTPASSGRGHRRDHPRSRGVYDRVRCGHVRGLGSSPLARGLRGDRRPRDAGMRIIPARAGFTPTARRARRRRRDHPRSRGVYSAARAMVLGGAGSSPLARGLRGRGCGGGAQDGIIPARAGFTRRR